MEMLLNVETHKEMMQHDGAYKRLIKERDNEGGINGENLMQGRDIY